MTLVCQACGSTDIVGSQDGEEGGYFAILATLNAQSPTRLTSPAKRYILFSP